MEIKVSYKTAVGNYRKVNQDAVLYLKNNTGQIMAVVCDGLGGHKCGEIASNMTIKMLQHFFETTDFTKLKHDKQVHIWLEEKINHIQSEMSNYSLINMQAADMGTTLVLLLITNNKAYLVNIGDSRIYQYGNHQLKQLTIDHNVLNLYLQKNKGPITESLLNHTYWKALTSALGPVKPLKIDIFNLAIIVPSYFLLTSDGVHDFLENDEIITILTKHTSLNNKVKLLIKQALFNVSTDNVTALLLQIT